VYAAQWGMGHRPGQHRVRIGRRTQNRFSTRTISIKDRPDVLG